MKIYFACTGNNEPRYLSGAGLNNILCSYYYYKKNPELIIDLIEGGVNVFIDSGAFSAKFSGAEIDIDEYSKFVIQTGSTFYAGLDVIGDAAATKKNQKYMEDEYGLNPIPTFHLGSRLEDALELAGNYEYIALGGIAMGDGVDPALEGLFNQILKVNPNIKTHGFAVTNTILMEKYPWESVDSSSFKAGKRFGRMALYNHQRNCLAQEDYNLWIEKYAALTTDPQIIDDTAFRYELTDILSAKAYQRLVDFLNSKNKDYTHLTAQNTLW